ncbi:HD domain-containing protein [Clostridium oryzae]|uniref:HD domain protein n=1 Tax=Clostridium oryzae TaxID=1450648 RepID=A0A1V4IWZ5_9CLOT|nr:HD domain-containing protein [Clostridium oryzae]OPJ63937.1 HD domain protein [Clostridium oryzae]
MDKIPTIREAEEILKEGEKLNPGRWVQHSRYVGMGARLIAGSCEGMNEETAYVAGLLHDIGRRVGVVGMRHTIEGYNYLSKKGYDPIARICLTHSHLTKEIKEIFGKWDCTEEEYKFIENYLRTIEYNDYDRLIQLCDCLAFPNGFTLMEKRMMDVALRYGVNEYSVTKWKATFQVKQYFEDKMGKSVYDVLPMIVKNIFK